MLISALTTRARTSEDPEGLEEEGEGYSPLSTLESEQSFSLAAWCNLAGHSLYG